jgi:hypothetical protein
MLVFCCRYIDNPFIVVFLLFIFHGIDRRGLHKQVMQPFCMQPFELRDLACRIAAKFFPEAFHLNQILRAE